MIDLDRIQQLQLAGSKQIQDLPAVEQNPLIGYSSMISAELMQFAEDNKLGIYELTNNAFRFGLSLGLRIKIDNAQVLER